MTTQYTPTLKLALPVTGELSGTWGDVVNDNITSMIEQAIAGLSTINTWTSNAHTLTTASGTTSESRCAMLVAATGGGAPTAAAQIICPAAAKLYVLQNNTSFAVTLKTSAGTGVAVAAGDTAFLFCDSTNVNSCVTTIVDGHITGNLTVDGNTTLGNATSDTITATARFNTDLIPSTDNARDLGSSANSWKDLYIDGTATIATLNVTTIDTTNLEVTNIKAKDGTAAIVLADVTGVATIAAAPVMTALTASKPVFTDASKALTSSGTLAYDQGGTGQTSYAAGDIVYASAINTLAKLTIGSSGQRLVVAAGLPSWATDATVGTVTSVAQSFTGGIVSVAGSPITTSGTLALTVAGTSGGVPYFSSGTTWATSAALAASALVIGGGAGAAPSTTTTGTGVVTALGVNTGTAGAFVVNGGALGSPSTAGTMPAFTLGGTVSGGGNQINNVVIGTTTPLAGNFTTLSATKSSTGDVATFVGSGGYTAYINSSGTGVSFGDIASLGANWSGIRTIYQTSVSTYAAGFLVTSTSSTGLAVTGTLSSTLGATIQGLTVGLGAGAVATNTAVGASALTSITSGAYNTSTGYQSSFQLTSGSYNSIYGYQALNNQVSTGSFNTVMGAQALYNNTTASNNTAVGHQAAYNSTGGDNIAIGYVAGKTLSSGAYNIVVGPNSMDNSAGITGSDNVAIGRISMRLLTSGLNNTSVGNGALNSISTANNNVAVGYSALSVSNASNNVAIGYQAGVSNTSGQSNVFIGLQSAFYNTTGSGNVSLGFGAFSASNGVANGTGSNNVAIGRDSLAFSTTGANNTAVGAYAGYGTNSGTQNVFIGYSSGYYNQTGIENTFVGFSANGNGTGGTASTGNTGVGRAVLNNNYGDCNTAVGNGALQINSSASNNTAVGYSAGVTNSVGASNVYVGTQAGRDATSNSNVFVGKDAGLTVSSGGGNTYVGFGAGPNSVAGTGGQNTTVGYLSGNAITTGSKNTILGAYTGNQNNLDIRTASNYIVLSDGDGNPRGWFDAGGSFNIGVLTSGNSNFIFSGDATSQAKGRSVQPDTTQPYGYYDYYFGNTRSGYLIWTSTTLSLVSLSDYRVKQNVANLTGAIERLQQLKPRKFNFISDPDKTIDGFVAHELGEVVPQAVFGEKDAVDESGNPVYQAIDQSKLIPLLTAALQEAVAEINSLKARLDAANL